MKTKIIQNIKSIILTLLLVFGVSYASAAWTNPPGTPPTCPDTTEGCNTPLNVSGTLQTKTGPLTIGGSLTLNQGAIVAGGIVTGTGSPTNGLIVQNGKVGIGTVDTTLGGTSTAKLVVATTDANSSGLVIANTANVPRFAINGQTDGSWAMYDFASGVYTRGLAQKSGNVGIGTLTPGAKLEVAGQVKITGGIPGAGKVLTSDATGLATWEAAGAGSGVTISDVRAAVEYMTNFASGSGTISSNASCSVSKKVVGGGCYPTGGGTPIISKTAPSSGNTGWECSVTATNGGIPMTLTATAICI